MITRVETDRFINGIACQKLYNKTTSLYTYIPYIPRFQLPKTRTAVTEIQHPYIPFFSFVYNVVVIYEGGVKVNLLSLVDSSILNFSCIRVVIPPPLKKKKNTLIKMEKNEIFFLFFIQRIQLARLV